MILRLVSQDHGDWEIRERERERDWKRVRRVYVFSLTVFAPCIYNFITKKYTIFV
jgi:hypothetical protein